MYKHNMLMQKLIKSKVVCKMNDYNFFDICITLQSLSMEKLDEVLM